MVCVALVDRDLATGGADIQFSEARAALTRMELRHSFTSSYLDG